MMQHVIPGGMMPDFAFFWITIGILVCLVLVATLVWLIGRWMNKQRAPMTPTQRAPQPQDAYQRYEQGYQPQQQRPETYQEAGQQYPYPQAQYEQPQVHYPQEMPLQH